jgi:heme-degrading monooxygenase HmoA
LLFDDVSLHDGWFSLVRVKPAFLAFRTVSPEPERSGLFVCLRYFRRFQQPNEVTILSFSIALTPIEQAVQQLVPMRTDYMLQPVHEGFNWDEAFETVEPGEWYLVAFRSRHSVVADEALLTEYDDRAREAAAHMPGFLLYFIGTPTSEGHCLSFCLWRTQQDARNSAKHSAHQAAQSLTASMFDYYTLERHRVIKEIDQLVRFETVSTS